MISTQIKPRSCSYPRQYETRAQFAGHLEIFFRPIKPTDANLLKEFFRSHSKQTILHRYFIPLHDLPPDLLHQFVNLDYSRDMAIVGLIPFEEHTKMLCVGRYCQNPGASDAEIAITVHDNYQRHGIGTFLFKYLARIARQNGITGFTADVMMDNHDMLGLIHHGANNIESTLEAGVYHLRFAFDEDAPAAQVLGNVERKYAVPFFHSRSTAQKNASK
jgi:GNAT superfamily N-acetyltransferase